MKNYVNDIWQFSCMELAKWLTSPNTHIRTYTIQSIQKKSEREKISSCLRILQHCSQDEPADFFFRIGPPDLCNFAALHWSLQPAYPAVFSTIAFWTLLLERRK